MVNKPAELISKLKKPKKLLQPVSITKLLPNILTLMGLIIGTNSIRFAIDDKWENAVYCVLIATIIDGLDGKLARMLNATSHFGAELDSLCDFVNFGLCPALMIYLWSFQQYEYNVISWASIMFFIVCMGLRLARFNTAILNPVESKQAKIFLTGMPAPAGALMALVPMMVDFEITKFFEEVNIREYTMLINGYVIFIATLLASRLPTVSLKNIRIKPEYLSLSMIIFAIIIIITAIYPWYILPVVALLYLTSIIICIRIAQKL